MTGLVDPLGGAMPVASPGLDEVTLEADGDAVVLVHTREPLVTQWAALSASTTAFVLFVILGVPAMNLPKSGKLLWTLVGLVAVAAVGLATQLRIRSTRVRMDTAGIQIEQGSAIDRERVELTWPDLTGVELEPVNPTDASLGMQLRITVRDGEPIDTLADVSVGDLTEARRMILERWQRNRGVPAT